MIDTLKEISIYEAILARKSIRQYTTQQVDAKRIRSLLEAAVMAPTVLPNESCAFVIVQDMHGLKAISEMTKSMLISQLAQNNQTLEALHQPAFNVFYEAHTLILICVNKDHLSSIANCWLAAENIMLAACAMDLGSCIIDTALVALNSKEGKLMLGIDEAFIAVAPIVVGFPSEKEAFGKRKKPLILNWIKA